MKSTIASVKLLVARIQKLRAARVFQLYSRKNGPILAGGLSLTALYSIFAGLYVGFAVVGLFVSRDAAFQQQIVQSVSNSFPGLIKTSGTGGAIDLDALFKSNVLGWSSIVALAALLFTALGWFASARSAVREMFGLPQDTTFFLLLKLKDLGMVVAAAFVIVLTAALSVLSTSALDLVFGLVGLDAKTDVARFAARILGLFVVLVIDSAVLAGLVRILVAAPLPWRRVVQGAVLGGVGLTVLQTIGGSIVGGTNKNPLLASFAVILGLLVYFGFVCQVILIAATWIAVDLADHGQSPSTTPGSHQTVAPPEHRRPRARAVSPPR